MCAPYKQLRRPHEAINQAKIAAEMFAGTSYEARAYSSIGNIYLQQLRDPNTAIAWFEKIPKPIINSPDGTVPPEEYGEVHMQYVSAQKSIARCEIKLGKAQDAIERFEELSQRYPQYRESFERDSKLQLDIDFQKRFRIDRKRQLDSILETPDFLYAPTATLSIEPNKSEMQSLQNKMIIEKDNSGADSDDPNSTGNNDVLAQSKTTNQLQGRIFIIVMIIALLIIATLTVFFYIFKKHKVISWKEL